MRVVSKLAAEHIPFNMIPHIRTPRPLIALVRQESQAPYLSHHRLLPAQPALKPKHRGERLFDSRCNLLPGTTVTTAADVFFVELVAVVGVAVFVQAFACLPEIGVYHLVEDSTEDGCRLKKVLSNLPVQFDVVLFNRLAIHTARKICPDKGDLWQPAAEEEAVEDLHWLAEKGVGVRDAFREVD